jgi:hypothetical protein
MLDPNISTTFARDNFYKKKKLFSSDDPWHVRRRCWRSWLRGASWRWWDCRNSGQVCFGFGELNENDEIARLMASVVARGAFWRWQDCKIYGLVCCGLKSFWRQWDCMINGQ